MKPNDKYRLKVPITDTELLDLGTGGVLASVATVEDTTGVFDDWRMQFRPVPGYPNELYAPFGFDNQLPYKIRELIGSDEVTAQKSSSTYSLATGLACNCKTKPRSKPRSTPKHEDLCEETCSALSTWNKSPT
ncbi:MAG: hypothetical protein IKR63_00985 [Alloprevotella sp.]|nr:hypothetical protein [Alloprevotella sp.]